MQDIVVGKRHGIKKVNQYTTATTRARPRSAEKDRHQTGLQVRVLDVPRALQESDTEHDHFISLRGGDDLWHAPHNELEVADNVVQEVFR